MTNDATTGSAALGVTGERRPADQTGQADQEGKATRTAQARRGQESSSPGPAGAAWGRQASATPRGQPADPALRDDPRPCTDAGGGDETDDLTGTDLVMRELGGQVIEEVTDL